MCECWAFPACRGLLCGAEAWPQAVAPLLPITAYGRTQNLHHVHIAVFHCSVVLCVVWFLSLPLSFSLSCFFVLPPSLPPSPPTTMPTSLLVLQGAGAVLVLLLCLPRTDVQEIPAQREKSSEREKARGSTWRQIMWTIGSAGAVWKCGIPFRDLKSCVAKFMGFVFLQHLGLSFNLVTCKVMNDKG